MLRDLDAGQCTVLLYPNQQYSYVPIGDSKKRLNIQGDRLSEFLGSSINPITESTGLKRKIAAVERRAGIENAKFLGKMLQGMTDSRIHTTGDYDKVIHNLGKTQIGLTNELAEVKQKRTTYAAAAKHLQICKTYKPVWMKYAAKPLNQKMEYFNQHSTELQAYRNAAAYGTMMNLCNEYSYFGDEDLFGLMLEWFWWDFNKFSIYAETDKQVHKHKRSRNNKKLKWWE